MCPTSCSLVEEEATLNDDLKRKRPQSSTVCGRSEWIASLLLLITVHVGPNSKEHVVLFRFAPPLQRCFRDKERTSLFVCTAGMRLLAVLFLVKILAAIGLADRIEELLRSVDDPVKNRLPVTPATKVIDATCGAYQRLTLNNDTIIRFSTAGFPSSPYPGSNCSATFFFNTTGFFVFEHLNLAVQDSISFSGPEDKSFSGNEWFSNSAFFYPSSPQGQIEVNVSLAVASQYQTAGFRLWVYPYAAGAAPLLCNDKKFCSESQMVFSPGFPYGNNFNVTGYEVHVPVNNNAYRYVISNLALQDSTLNLGDATPTGSVTTPKDNAATCNGAGYYEYDFVVNFTRPTGASNEYFVVAVQSNNNPAMGQLSFSSSPV
uniref:CUB domain-containing protein n=1 Tax=Steinernema glaseri TaxID=37863 RepID=A0A1I7ZLN8_9BILA